MIYQVRVLRLIVDLLFQCLLTHGSPARTIYQLRVLKLIVEIDWTLAPLLHLGMHLVNAEA